MKKFPQGFLWGAATSSYQVEGNNNNTDWWFWEKQAGKEQSAKACNHYELYTQDFDLAKSLNHNAHRLSIEWARIEPTEGEFSQKEINHYIEVLQALKSRGIEPMVTLHHFTNPIWLSAKGGWEKKQSVALFRRYCDVVVRALARHVRYWITINESTILASHAYLFGAWPPQAKSLLKMTAVHHHLLEGHIQSYRLIHSIYKEFNLAKPLVSLSHHMPEVTTCNGTLRNRLAVFLRDWWFNFAILDKVISQNTMDYIGINYYSRQLVDTNSWWIGNLMMGTCQDNHLPTKKNSLGWDIYPEGLYQILLKLKRYNLPVIITENGICTSDDDLRWEFICKHLESVHRAMSQGVNVTGYLYWSLLDNFEWDKGFGPRFGLIDVNYGTQQRIIKESAKKFSKVCQTGILEE